MKKFLLLIFIFISFTSRSQTSIYHPFPDSNAVWNFQAFAALLPCTPFGGGSIEHRYSYTIDGDTSINSMMYHKLITPYVHTHTDSFCLPFKFPGYKGAFRQDTAARKVYFVPDTAQSEYLLYDFTMEVGDTIKGFLAEVWSGSLMHDTVSTIDSVLVGNDYRKRWKINECYSIYMVEGIGSLFGLLEPTGFGCITDLPWYVLNCFTQDGQTLYPDTTTFCPLLTGLNAPELNEDKLTFPPNPFSSKTVVKIDPVFMHADFVILNIEGKIVRRGRVNNQKELVITADDLKNGVYLLQLTNGNGVTVSGKFIVDKY